MTSTAVHHQSTSSSKLLWCFELRWRPRRLIPSPESAAAAEADHKIFTSQTALLCTFSGSYFKNIWRFWNRNIIQNSESVSRLCMYFSFTFIDLFSGENGSDESAALLGIINCIFKCVCPDTVYQNKHIPSYCLEPESLTYLFQFFFVFFFTALLLWFSVVGTVGCFCSQV